MRFTRHDSEPLDRLLAYRRRMGWSFSWASSARSDFNFDFEVSYTAERLTDDERANGIQHNFRRMPADPSMLPIEAAGMSAFALDGGVVYHTYSAYARGTDALWGMYQWLDRAEAAAGALWGEPGGACEPLLGLWRRTAGPARIRDRAPEPRVKSRQGMLSPPGRPVGSRQSGSPGAVHQRSSGGVSGSGSSPVSSP